MKPSYVAALALLAAAPAVSAQTLLNFETVTSFASINQYYNGGADSAGNVGPALGVSFGPDALGLVNDFNTYFSNAPSPIGVMAPVGPAATMNVPAGFTNSIGLFYSSSAAVPNAVQIWSGLDGTGSALASFNLLANAQTGCTGSPFCRFDPLVGLFAGTARSVTFANAASVAAFDNIGITTVPEPTTALLLALGVAGLVAARGHGRAAQSH